MVLVQAGKLGKLAEAARQMEGGRTAAVRPGAMNGHASNGSCSLAGGGSSEGSSSCVNGSSSRLRLVGVWRGVLDKPEADEKEEQAIKVRACRGLGSRCVWCVVCALVCPRPGEARAGAQPGACVCGPGPGFLEVTWSGSFGVVGYHVRLTLRKGRVRSPVRAWEGAFLRLALRSGLLLLLLCLRARLHDTRYADTRIRILKKYLRNTCDCVV